MQARSVRSDCVWAQYGRGIWFLCYEGNGDEVHVAFGYPDLQRATGHPGILESRYVRNILNPCGAAQPCPKSGARI